MCWIRGIDCNLRLSYSSIYASLPHLTCENLSLFKSNGSICLDLCFDIVSIHHLQTKTDASSKCIAEKQDIVLPPPFVSPVTPRTAGLPGLKPLRIFDILYRQQAKRKRKGKGKGWHCWDALVDHGRTDPPPPTASPTTVTWQPQTTLTFIPRYKSPQCPSFQQGELVRQGVSWRSGSGRKLSIKPDRPGIVEAPPP